MFRKFFTNTAIAFAMFFAAIVSLSAIVSADDVLLLPENSIIKELSDNSYLKLAQATETAVEKAARKKEERRIERERKKEERRIERERKKAERAKKRKERKKNRPKSGSFS